MAERTVIDEIQDAQLRLGLSPSMVRLLPQEQGEAVYGAAVNRFVAKGDRRWWWEDFRDPAVTVNFEDGEGWRRITSLVPDANELVWLVAEESGLPHYPVFETTPMVAACIIGECYAFEYYLVAKDLSWLLCETHHNTMCAIGPAVEARLLNAG